MTDQTLQTTSHPTLQRTGPAPRVRIVHMGLGAFSRSHTAWYTSAATDAAQWGIAAYTARNAELPARLTEQSGLFTLVERGAEGDEAIVVDSISRAHAGGEVQALTEDLANPETVIVTLTITEAGYSLDPVGDSADVSDPAVAADIAELRTAVTGKRALDTLQPRTAFGRLVLGLEARRRGDAGPLAVVSCDNLPDNGGKVSRGLLDWAGRVDHSLRDWIAINVECVSTSVDRITPSISEDERQALAAAYGDAVPVVAEPFHDWAISGRFPGGHPDWGSAGARFVDNLRPWEERKLWLLNGAHTLLASLGLLRGYETVAQAITDSECREAVLSFWDEAERHLPAELNIADYRAALLQRFENRRIEHRLAQIAKGSVTKARLRIVPVAERERAAGRAASASAKALAACLEATQEDAGDADSNDGGRGGTLAPRYWISAISTRLGDDAAFVQEVSRCQSILRS